MHRIIEQANRFSVINPFEQSALVSNIGSHINPKSWKKRLELLKRENLIPLESQFTLAKTRKQQKLVATTMDFEKPKIKKTVFIEFENDSSNKKNCFEPMYNPFICKDISVLNYSHVKIAALVSMGLAHIGFVSSNPSLSCSLYSNTGLFFKQNMFNRDSAIFTPKGIMAKYFDEICLALDHSQHSRTRHFVNMFKRSSGIDKKFQEYTVFYQDDLLHTGLGLLNLLSSYYKLKLVPCHENSFGEFLLHKGKSILLKSIFEKDDYPFNNLEKWKFSRRVPIHFDTHFLVEQRICSCTKYCANYRKVEF